MFSEESIILRDSAGRRYELVAETESTIRVYDLGSPIMESWCLVEVQDIKVDGCEITVVSLDPYSDYEVEAYFTGKVELPKNKLQEYAETSEEGKPAFLHDYAVDRASILRG